MGVIAKINQLIDQHENYIECKGCPKCDEIARLRKQLEGPSKEKIQRILNKGQDMTRSDIVYLINAGVTRTTIRKHLKMDSTNFFKMLKDFGLSKEGELEGALDVAEDKRKTLKLDVDEYLELSKTKSVKEIANLKGVSVTTIYNWIKKNKKEIDKARKKAVLDEFFQSEGKTTPKEEKAQNEPKKDEIKRLENELREEYEREIENLKKEVIDAHKLVTEWQEKYEKLREQFSDALQVKDIAIKENAELENERLKLERENIALARELDSLRKEKAVLVEFSYLKLAKEVETA